MLRLGVLLAVLLVCRPSHASQIHLQYVPLSDMMYGLLVTVTSYTAGTATLKATVKRIWSKRSSNVAVGEQRDFLLWSHVRWTDATRSPIERLVRGASDERTFRPGQTLILVEAGNGAETFVDTPRMQQTLDLVVEPAGIAPLVRRLSPAELESWLDDPHLGDAFVAEAVRQGKLGRAQVVAMERASTTHALRNTTVSWLAAQPQAEGFALLEALCAGLDLDRPEALDKLKSLLVEDKLPGMTRRGRMLLVERLDPSRPAQAELIAESLRFYVPETSLVEEPALVPRVRAAWVHLVSRSSAWDAEFKELSWSRLSPAERHAIMPTLAAALERTSGEPFYRTTLFAMLLDELVAHGRPADFDVLRPVWSDPRFFTDHTSGPQRVVESIATMATRDPVALPLLRELHATAVQRGVRFAWDTQRRLDALLQQK